MKFKTLSAMQIFSNDKDGANEMIISVKVLKGELNLKKNVTKHNKHVLGTLHSSFVYFTVEYISINSVLITIYPLPCILPDLHCRGYRKVFQRLR